MKDQTICIIGAGTAGVASAILLSRLGHRVTLMEQAPRLEPVGAGILLQPVGLNVLGNMGLRAELERYGAPIDGIYGWNRSGATVLRTEYADLDASLYGLGIHRASLCHVLDQALDPLPHERLLGCRVKSVDNSASSVQVAFEHQGVTETRGFDVAIVANGSASQLRPREWVRYDRQYPWGAMWSMLPAGQAPLSRGLKQCYDGARYMAGLLPTGTTPGDAGRRVSFFWSLPGSAMQDWQSPSFDLQAWKAEAAWLWPGLEPFLKTINSQNQLLPATYRDVIMKQWTGGRMAVIGDAAHGMSPQLGQGANMALVDAEVLSRAVAEHDSWEDVWRKYHRRRKGQIRFYQSMSRLLTPFFQSAIPGIGLARDAGFQILNRIPWLRKEMARTVAGLKSGYVIE